MKHIKLFESWLEDLVIIGDKPETQPAPDEVKALVAKVDFGSKVVGKDILNPKNDHATWTGFDGESWIEKIEQKLKKALGGKGLKGLGFKTSMKTTRFYVSLGENYALEAVHTKESVIIAIIDTESFKTVYYESYYGTTEETSDAVVAAVTNPKNLKILTDLKNSTTVTPEAKKSKSLEALTNDKIAVSVHNKIKNINVSDSAESVAHGILLQTLYYGPDAEARRAGIETIVNTLNKYLGDKDYTERMGQ